MPKIVSEDELSAIIAVTDGHPEGVAVATIRERLDFSLPERMLQRRLKRLIDMGRITSQGSGKGKRYFPIVSRPATAFVSAPAPRIADSSDSVPTEVIPLSPEAREIREMVRQPVIARTPAGYKPDFLGRYVPNQSAYLSADIRAELARVNPAGPSDLPAGTYFRKVLDRLLIDLSWNSSRLEGNTYSLLETERLLEMGEGADGHDAEETRMILNHKAAIEMLADQANQIGFNRYTICNLHALLADSLLKDPASCGRVRSVPVGIGGTVFHPLEVPQLIEERFDEILGKAEAIEDPFEQAFFVMVQLPYLQPFEDVNKRVSRLAANIPLVRRNLCPLSFVDVPQEEYVGGLIGVYELNRVEYLRDVFVWAYRRSAERYAAVVRSLGEPDPFQLKYRNQIGDFVREIVLGRLDKRAAARRIAERAEAEIPPPHRARFIEFVETELGCLHVGNIARFRLRPEEFEDWRAGWR